MYIEEVGSIFLHATWGNLIRGQRNQNSSVLLLFKRETMGHGSRHRLARVSATLHQMVQILGKYLGKLHKTLNTAIFNGTNVECDKMEDMLKSLKTNMSIYIYSNKLK